MSIKTLIIAEAGVNHNGNIDIAKKMIEVAKEAGADIIKFQTANLDKLVSKFAEMATYQKETLGFVKTQKDMLGDITLAYEDFYILADYCKQVGIEFLSTPFDIESVYFLRKLGCNFWKIPSGEITNYPYLVEIAKTNMPVIMSTGMSELDEIKSAISVLKENGCGELTLLQCNTQYPTPYEDANINAMKTIERETGLPVGYSDHTQGIEVSIAAVALGAKVIEKHFTLDRNMEGPDHNASLEPNELKAMVSAIRNIEMALGDGEKKVSKSERENIEIARKSIVASKKIKKGEILSCDNITTKRPGSGINPMRWNEIIGTVAIRDFDEDELIETGKK